jgi:hypothetical protein
MTDGAAGNGRAPRGAGRGAAEAAPLWRQGYDAMEREVAPRLDAMVRSDGFAQAMGVVARLQRAVQQEVARSTRRWLHLLNLPAATDVSRILTEMGRLEKQVRDLTHQLEAAQRDGRARAEAEEVIDARAARPGRPRRPRPA